MATGLVAVSFSGTSFAQSTGSNFFEGAYAGVGYGAGKIKITTVNDATSVTDRNDKNTDGVYFMGGYRQETPYMNIMVGAEVSYYLAGSNKSIRAGRIIRDDLAYASATQNKGSLGFDLMGGYVLGPDQNFLVFATLGVQSMKLDVADTSFDSYSKLAITAGVGGEAYIWRGLGLRTNVKFGGASIKEDLFDGGLSYKGKKTANSINLAMIYNF